MAEADEDGNLGALRIVAAAGTPLRTDVLWIYARRLRLGFASQAAMAASLRGDARLNFWRGLWGLGRWPYADHWKDPVAEADWDALDALQPEAGRAGPENGPAQSEGRIRGRRPRLMQRMGGRAGRPANNGKENGACR